MKSICNLCGNVEHHQLALHATCGSGECEGMQVLLETDNELVNDPDDGSWVGR